jgi:hypothetical protein
VIEVATGTSRISEATSKDCLGCLGRGRPREFAETADASVDGFALNLLSAGRRAECSDGRSATERCGASCDLQTLHDHFLRSTPLRINAALYRWFCQLGSATIELSMS